MTKHQIGPLLILRHAKYAELALSVRRGMQGGGAPGWYVTIFIRSKKAAFELWSGTRYPGRRRLQVGSRRRQEKLA
jgi:hypothetical protein